MSGLVTFLEPAPIGVWLGRTLLLYLVTYLTLWLAAMLLARLVPREGHDPIMQVYLGWLVPTGLHLLSWAAVLLQLLGRYHELGLSLWPAILYLLPVIVDAILILQLVMMMRNRRLRWKQVERED